MKKIKRKGEPFLRKKGEELSRDIPKVESSCSIHDSCGGCSYLEISYENELILKGQVLAELWKDNVAFEVPVWEPVVPSPNEFRHRSKLSLQLKRMRDGSVVLGTSPFGSKEVIPFSRCPVVMEGVETVVPEVLEGLKGRNLEGIKRACIVIRESQDKKVDWGGLGRGSLNRSVEESQVYSHAGMEVRYDLKGFFQSNLSILPKLFEELMNSLGVDEHCTFVDLYGGVGLFSIMVGHKAKSILMIEENPDSLEFAHYNREINTMAKMKILRGRVEDHLETFRAGDGRWVAVIDPPRAGMTSEVRQTLLEASQFEKLAYLSCNPETQLRDVKELCASGKWKVIKLLPFDFFPKSYHIESLAILERVENFS